MSAPFLRTTQQHLPPSSQPANQLDLDLVQALENLQVSTQNEVPGSSNSRQQEEALETQFNLLIQIPDNQGQPRPLNITQVSTALKQAWGERYAAVNHVEGNLFLATFYTSEDMMFVIKRQPWTVQNYNILLELYVPGKPLHQYRFDYLYANVRMYGLPREFRAPTIIDGLLRQIGQPSDLHEQNEADIMRDENYALTKAKLKVTTRAVDKLFQDTVPNRRIIVFMYYEKIRKICNFCGGFFHRRTDCPARLAKVLVDGEDPPDLFGNWIFQSANEND